jgi:hypothetical protein
MTPQQFPQANRKLVGPEGGDIKDLPVYSDGRFCVSCWKATWRERLAILLTGQVWLLVWSGRTQPPVSVFVEQPDWRDAPLVEQAENDVRALIRAALKRARKAVKHGDGA